MKDLEYKDQADSLRNEVKSAEEDTFEYSTSSLPSRKEIHSKKKQKVVWKVKFSLVKILAVFFILLIITTFAIYSHLTKGNKSDGILANSKPSYSEEIKGYDSYDSEDKESIVTDDEEEQDKKPEKVENNKTQVNKQEEDPKNSQATKDTESNPSKPAVTEPKETNKVSKPTTNTNKVEDKKEESQESNKGKVVQHTVQPSETVYRIAMKYYSSTSGIEKIKQYNGLKDNNIHVGQVLQIPLD
ncbi:MULTISPECIES: LysM peptidoglycan-binding domain-containing protein [Bacillus]|uniref:LysM peptidoglycan-binding domain-containing protein n=1 Tax=Bacillus TaxID=1386 RepID=UPI0002EF4461|nr:MULTISPECIES: LysM peptidoglycan-binding domain-containing protein [Bacillus]